MAGDSWGLGGGWLAGLADGSRVGAYVLQDRVGAGGMAVVFRARDERLGRLVALKVLAPALAADAGFRQRFIREAQAAAAVDDPHILPVHEAGEADGVQFIAMRFVAGGDLRAVVARDGPLPASRAAGLVSAAASALDAAHAAGLVHRDVKPANMLVDVRPGRPDHLYVSDFGLAKDALWSTSLTGSGVFLGTPDYCAPEQASGATVDGRADQYALACVAFTLLAGVPPFRRDMPMAVLLAHLRMPPPSLVALRPDLPAATDGVLARALAKAPEDRYPSCGDFAGALRGALGLPPYGSVAVEPDHRPARESTHQTGAAAREAGMAVAEATGNASTISVAAPIVPGPAGHVQHAARKRTLLDSGRHRAALATALAIVLLAAVAVIAAALGPGAHKPQAAVGRTPAPARKAVTVSLIATLTDPGSLGVHAAVFSPDGKVLATDDLAGDSYDGRADLWDVASRTRIAGLAAPRASVRSVSFSPDGKVLATADYFGHAVDLWNVATRARIVALADPSDASPTSAAFSPDGKLLATADDFVSVYLWDAATHTKIATLTRPYSSAAVPYVVFSPDGKLLAEAANDSYESSTYLWNVANRTRIALTDPFSRGVSHPAFSPDGKLLATADANGSTYLWDIATRTNIAILTDPSSQGVGSVILGAEGVRSAVFSPDGKLLATADANGNAYLWDVATRTRIATLADPVSQGVRSVAFSPDGKLLATADVNGSAYLWTLKNA